MKCKTWIIGWLFLLPLLVFAESNPKPEKIYSITKVAYPIEYYYEQADLWQMEIDKNQQDANAWRNYYFACRMANILNPAQEAKRYDLAKIVERIGKAIPDTYEYHYLSYANTGFSNENFFHLERAYELDPDRTDVYASMFAYYEVKRNKERARFFAKKLSEAGEFSSDLMKWNYNVAMSLTENAMLLTYGDNDTYPLWLLQYVQNIRPDVAVLNIHLLRIKSYRDQVFKENGIPLLAEPDSQFLTQQELVEHLFNQSTRPTYLGVAFSNDIRRTYSNKLYLTGLALKYSPDEFDNLSELKTNVEQKFLIDYLKIDFYEDFGAGVMHQMNANYIPAFILLYKHYREVGAADKADEMKSLIKKLALSAGMGDKVVTYFEKQLNPPAHFKSSIPIESLERNFKVVRKNLRAGKTEVTNDDYDLFLMDLLKQKEYELLDQCRPAKSNWRQLAQERFRNKKEQLVNIDKTDSRVDYATIPDEKLFLHFHPDQGIAPVQNISYEAAKLYCEWITRVYNQGNAKKKKYKKVIFRLPTEEEWEFAASSGQTERVYPWGNDQITNDKGCFLSNFNAPCKEGKQELAGGSDGGFFPVAADAYFENDFGLYNMSGNVAEMIAVKGKAKGGSWADEAVACTIKSVSHYKQADPTLGFRVFMEIVE